MTGTAGIVVLLVGMGAGVLTVVLQLPGHLRAVRHPGSPIWSELRLRALNRLVMAVTTLLVSIVLVVRVLTANSPSSPILQNYHVLDAVSSATVILGIALMVMAFVWFPPVGFAALAGGGAVLVSTATGTFAATLAGGATLTLTGVLLRNAAQSRSSTSDRSGSSGGTGASERPVSANRVGSNARANEIAQRLGYDNAEKLKEGFLGRNALVSRWDMFVDTKTHQLWLATKDGVTWLATGLFVR